jgi:hypothetical protein
LGRTERNYYRGTYRFLAFLFLVVQCLDDTRETLIIGRVLRISVVPIDLMDERSKEEPGIAVILRTDERQTLGVEHILE